MRVSVRNLFFSLRRGADSCLIGAGEVGKLLGAKWKELDDDEKKVRRCAINESDHRSIMGAAVYRASCEGQGTSGGGKVGV